METAEALVDRGARLFRYLARAQQLRTAAVPTTSRYERDGAVHWLAAVPTHPAVRLAGEQPGTSGDEDLVLTIARIPKVDAPALPVELEGWVDLEPQSLKAPVLRRERRVDPGGAGGAQARGAAPSADSRADAEPVFTMWLAAWESWATRERTDRPVRDLYARLFRTHMSAVQRSEELELLLGAGLLTWHAEEHQPVSRHVFTAPVAGAIDDQTGTLTFTLDSSAIGIKVELDMLDPSLVPQSSVVTELDQAGTEFGGSLMNEPDIGPLGRSLVNKLAAGGRYDATMDRPTPTPDPVVSWAPALILRVRPNTGLVAVFEKISEEIAQTGIVPEGLMPLLDPDRVPIGHPDPSPGALLDVDGEVFSPLPLNRKQRDILDRVDHNAQTIVQGPPGTGKTHTAAALLSHLLAQGKRVLVTAQTDRALGEVRSKLPDQVKPLAVSVIGSSRSDMADLKVAVETIGRRSVDHDHADASRRIETALREVEELRRRRIGLADRLVTIRERETRQVTHGDYRGTLAQIAQRCDAEAPDFDWLTPLVDITPDTPAPLTNEQASRWRALLVDPVLTRDAVEAQLRHLDRSDLPTPAEFLALIQARSAAEAEAGVHEAAAGHPAMAALRALQTEHRADVRSRLHDVLANVNTTERFPGAWVPAAIADTRAGFAALPS